MTDNAHHPAYNAPMSGLIETEVFTVDPQNPDPRVIERAAAIIRDGGLVAFPTETVYGLGADAFSEAAVRRIFEAKGRPPTNPIIVHVGSMEVARDVVSLWPQQAAQLAAAFWPGPLTIVLPKSQRVPHMVTAGRETVAVRMPAHPVALALLKACAVPVAAPSANRSSSVSPTRADHVLKGLGGRIDAVLDGGPTSVGIESTVVDLTGESVCVLRPGSVNRMQIESVLNEPVDFLSVHLEVGESARAPGMQSRHYAPSAQVEIIEAARLIARLQDVGAPAVEIGVLAISPQVASAAQLASNAVVKVMPGDPESYAGQLYLALHELDDRAATAILIESPPRGEDWRAVHDRLNRMSSAG